RTASTAGRGRCGAARAAGGGSRASSRLETEQAHLLLALAREEVDAVDEAHPVAAGAHHERMRPGAVGEEADAAEEVAVRNARRGHDHLAGREIVDREDAAVVIDPHRLQLV